MKRDSVSCQLGRRTYDDGRLRSLSFIDKAKLVCYWQLWLQR